MSEGENTILTCASCGKSFKGVSVNAHSKFKCASCTEVTTVGHSHEKSTGKILCGNCWSGIELREELYKTSQNLMGGDSGGSPANDKLSQANLELEGRIVELQARLALEEEGKAAAIREKEIAAEARAKLEKTLSEFLGKFASVRGAEMTAVKDRDAAIEARRNLERKIKDLETQLSLAQETEAAAMGERNGAAAMRAEMEAKVSDMEAQLNAAREALNKERTSGKDRRDLDEKLVEMESQIAEGREREAAIAAERTGALRAKAELEAKMKDMEAKLAAAQETVAQKQDVDADEVRELKAKIGEMHAELVAAQVEHMSSSAERDVAVTAKQEMDAKITDLQDRLAKALEAQTAATRERDEIKARAERERSSSGDVQAVRDELNRLREAACTALEPLGMECNTKMKDLMAETEQVLSEAKQTREEANDRLQRVELMVSELRTNINLVRRHVTGRVAMVLGVPAGESGTSAAVMPEKPKENAPVAGAAGE